MRDKSQRIALKHIKHTNWIQYPQSSLPVPLVASKILFCGLALYMTRAKVAQAQRRACWVSSWVRYVWWWLVLKIPNKHNENSRAWKTRDKAYKRMFLQGRWDKLAIWKISNLLHHISLLCIDHIRKMVLATTRRFSELFNCFICVVSSCGT